MKLRYLIDGDAYAIYRSWRLGRYRKARRVQSARPAGVQARQTASLPLYQKLGLRDPARHMTAKELAIEAHPNREGFRYYVRLLPRDMLELQITVGDGRLCVRGSIRAYALSLPELQQLWLTMQLSLEDKQRAGAIPELSADEFANMLKRRVVPCSPELSAYGLPYILCSPGTTIDVDALAGGVSLAVPAGDPLPVTPSTPEQSALHAEWARMNELANASYLAGELDDESGEIGVFAKLLKRER